MFKYMVKRNSHQNSMDIDTNIEVHVYKTTVSTFFLPLC